MIRRFASKHSALSTRYCTGFQRPVSHVGAANQRRGLNVVKPELARSAAKLRELGRGVIAPDRMVTLRGREVLTHGEDIHAGFAEVPGNLENLFLGLSEAEHDAGLRHHPVASF